MTYDRSVSDTVMRRVRAIHALRAFGAPLVATFFLTASLWGIGRLVWVAKVFENLAAAGNLTVAPRFFIEAFLGTGVVEQGLVTIALIAGFWLMVEFLKTTERHLFPSSYQGA